MDLECCDDYNKDKRQGSVRHRQPDMNNTDQSKSYLQRITFILLSIYFFMSACISLFYYPLSILSLITPLIVVTITICAAMNKRTEETLWFCAIASALGAFGKVIALIIFSIVFGFNRSIDMENRRRGMQSQQSKEGKKAVSQLMLYLLETVKRELWLTQFFVVLLAAEALLMVSIACIRCNFQFVKKCLHLE